MKHAYLIIAHNEFEVLKKLLQAIDDPRNDVYIHFDKKVKQLPEVTMQYSTLYILDNRIDVHWGHISQIETEYILFETSYRKNSYRYYHLISGTHLPLYSQDKIHAFFDTLNNQQVFQALPTNAYERDLKMHRYNFFIKHFQHPNASIRLFIQQCWTLTIKIQRILHIRRNKNAMLKKAGNWVSLTEAGLAWMLSVKKAVLKKYRFSFCGDEWFIPSELENSALKSTLLYYDKLLKQQIERANSKTWRYEDYEELIHSDYLFARRFSHEDMKVVNKILDHIKSMP
jgi:hypothetical protein